MIFDIEKYSTLPKGWSKVKLSDLADFNAKSWSKKDKPNTIHYIDISSVSTGRVENPTGMLFDEAPSRARRKVSSGDIIISTVRPNLKQFALLDFELENLTASTGFCTITPKKAEYTWLIYSIITTDIFTEHLVRVAQGAAYPAIKPSDIADAYVGLPPEHELMKFNLLVSALWQKQSVNETMNQTLEKIAQRIFKSWFIDFDPVKANKEGVAFDGLSPEIQALFPSEFEESELGMIPKDWTVQSIEKVSHILNGYAFKSGDYVSQDVGTFVLRTKNFTKGLTERYQDDVFLPQSFFESHSKYLSEPFDYHLVMVGASLGNTGMIFPHQLPAFRNQNMWSFRTKSNAIASQYFIKQALDHLIKNSFGLKTGSAREFFRKKDFGEQKVCIPTQDIMRKFSLITNGLVYRISNNHDQIETLIKLRDRLLPKLISGQITVGEAQKELAELI